MIAKLQLMSGFFGPFIRVVVYLPIGPSENQREYPKREDHSAEDTSDHYPCQWPGTLGADTMRHRGRKETNSSHEGGHHDRPDPRVDTEPDGLIE